MLKIIAFFICTFSYFFSNAQNPTYEWQVGIGGNDYDYGYEVKTDNLGNVYHVGFFTGICDFDSGPGVFNLTGSFNQDMFIVKYNASGNFVWAKTLAPLNITAQVQQNISMKIDQLGNIYLTGSYRDSIDWDPGPSTFVMPSSGHSVFVLKLSSAGNFVWAKNFIGITTLFNTSYSLDIDASNNVYTTGYFTGTIDFDPSSGVANLVSTGGNDIFISKLDPNGNFIFVKQIGAAGDDEGLNLMIGNGGAIYTSGHVSGSPDMNPGTGSFIFPTSNVSYMLKLDANGNFIWAKDVGAVANGSQLDQNNNIYRVGVIGYPQTIDFDPGAAIVNLSSFGFTTTYLSKLDSNGNFKWAKSIKGTMSTSYADGNAMTIDNHGNLYAVGELVNGIFDFDPSPAVFNLDGTGSNMFITKFDSNGNFIWAVKDEGSGGAIPYSVALYGNSKIYTSGRYYGTVDFDPGLGFANFTSNGYYDAFIHKMSLCPSSSSSITQPACNSFTFNSQTYTSTGTYVQILVNAVGCDSIITLNLTINSTNTSLSQVGSVLTANASSPALYQWIKCSPFSIISGATNQSYNATLNGSYAVIVTESGCSDTSNCLSVTGLDVKSPELSNKSILYPNPANDFLHLEFGAIKRELTVKITSVSNAILYDQKFNSVSEIKIPIKNLPIGLYFVHIIEDKRNTVLNFTKN